MPNPYDSQLCDRELFFYEIEKNTKRKYFIFHRDYIDKIIYFDTCY